MIAFDIDVLMEILLGDPTFVARVVTIPPHEQAVPLVVIEEILRGRLRVIRQADTLYLQWRHQGIRVGTHDLRIAAICVVHEDTLISRNRQDYTRVPGLHVEFWQ
jgi:tRNA(fMet)-specific endonuclease VapC